MKRSTIARRRPPVNANEQAARRLVRARSNGYCEVRLDGCQGRASNWHHRQNRSQGGRWTAANGLDVCGTGTTGCHGKLTDTRGHRAEYEAAGWIVPCHQDPRAVPALIHTATLGHDYVLLRDDGCIQLAPWPPHGDLPAGAA